MKRFILAAAIFTFPALSFFGAASAEGFNQFVGFGDSTLDTGYFRFHTTGIPQVDQVIVIAIAQGANGGWAGNGVMNTTIGGKIWPERRANRWRRNQLCNSGITALSFGSQTRDSLVSQLGWRGSVDIDNRKPYVEAEWNHEWTDKDRLVMASLTSVTAAPYATDAVPIASDWATASLGTSYKLTPQVMLRAATSAVFFNSQATSYGGELGLIVSF